MPIPPLESPLAYPLKYDSGTDRIGFIALDRDGYRTASFLDERLGRPDPQWRGTSEVTERVREGSRPLHVIFHTGHVGSTLLSRLLDEHPAVLGLREPLPLRTLADLRDRGDSRFESRLELFLTLWSRGFAETDAVVVKATSSTGRIAPSVLAARPKARAVYLSLALEPYLATLLAGANAVLDLRALEPERRRRLRTGYGLALPVAVSTGELAAIAWLAENLSRAEASASERVLPLDFDAVLADLPSTMAKVFAHFGIDADKTFVDGLARSPVLTRYSKAPDAHAYSVALRTQVLAQARETQAIEIAKGMRLIDRLARDDPRIAALL